MINLYGFVAEGSARVEISYIRLWAVEICRKSKEISVIKLPCARCFSVNYSAGPAAVHASRDVRRPVAVTPLLRV